MADYSPMGPSWEEVRREIFTPDEVRESDRRVAEIGVQIGKMPVRDADGEPIE